jgi:hypothetical protein
MHQIKDMLSNQEITIHHGSINGHLNMPQHMLWRNVNGAKRQVTRPARDV